MSIPVSVVVVSRDRPEALYRCILGLSQVQYTPFEIVVVADSVGLATLGRFADQIKTILFEEPNISAARNLGVSHAAGDVVAFIDDDAVPEPSWLAYLTEPFEQRSVAIVGGFVIGRNGISFQWKARVLDDDGFTRDVSVDENQFTIFEPKIGRVTKTEGTNMAVRRDVLVDVGGFDPAFHFYLDETDLNMRLAQNGYETAIAPMAQVHHGFAQSSRRRIDRVPRNLFDIGASWAVFQRKFLMGDYREAHWEKIVKTERNRLIRHLVSGGLEPKEVRRLLEGLKMGYKKGQQREITTSRAVLDVVDPLKIYPSPQRESNSLITRPVSSRRVHAEAIKRVKDGEIVTVLILSSTALFHHVSFHEDGYWVQTGGIFGKSLRSQKLLKLWSRKRRVAFERQRIEKVRLL